MAIVFYSFCAGFWKLSLPQFPSASLPRAHAIAKCTINVLFVLFAGAFYSVKVFRAPCAFFRARMLSPKPIIVFVCALFWGEFFFRANLPHLFRAHFCTRLFAPMRFIQSSDWMLTGGRLVLLRLCVLLQRCVEPHSWRQLCL